jgi:hypothetical protein
VELNRHPVRVEIGALVLDGIEPRDRRAVAHAAERELERLLGERGLPAMLSAGGEHRVLQGQALELARGEDGASLGAGVARAVYGAFGP